MKNTTSSLEDKVKNYGSEIKQISDFVEQVRQTPDVFIGKVKENNYEYISNEINKIKEACNGKLLKVIIETCLLTEDEKIKLCEVVSNSKADYIKTSTGFSTAGATLEDIILFKNHIKNGKKIKAAGGIKDFQDAQKFIEAGADRLGTSRLIK